MDTFIIIIIIIVVIVIALLLAFYFKWPIDITGGASTFEQQAIKIVRELTGHDFYPVKIALQELRPNIDPFNDAFDGGTIGDAFDIDGYCAELNTAIEVQGWHHYRSLYEDSTKSSAEHQEALRKTNRHDQMKRIWCESRGINLVTIPVSVQEELVANKIRTAYWHIASILRNERVPMNYYYKEWYKDIKEPPARLEESPHKAQPYYAVDFSQCPLHIICARFDYIYDKGLYSLSEEPPKLDPEPNTTPIHMFLQRPCSTNSAIVKVESREMIFKNLYHCRAIIESNTGAAQWGQTEVINPPVLNEKPGFNPRMAKDFWTSIHRSPRTIKYMPPLTIPYELLKSSVTDPEMPLPIVNQKKIAEINNNKRNTPTSSLRTQWFPRSSAQSRYSVAPAAKQVKPNF